MRIKHKRNGSRARGLSRALAQARNSFLDQNETNSEEEATK